jgi:hypothetical protein
MRRRGVETKLVPGDEAQRPDRKLVASIATAVGWIDRIEAGRSYAETPNEHGVPKYREQQAICFAILAPDVIRQFPQGRQAIGLTSKWLFRHSLPFDWAEQSSLIAMPCSPAIIVRRSASASRPANADPRMGPGDRRQRSGKALPCGPSSEPVPQKCRNSRAVPASAVRHHSQVKWLAVQAVLSDPVSPKFP